MHQHDRIADEQLPGAAVFDESVTAWMHQGNCRVYPPSTFFPSDGVGVDRARKICVGCPVLTRCLDYALEQRIDHGVWGGCSERDDDERRPDRRRDGQMMGGLESLLDVAVVSVTLVGETTVGDPAALAPSSMPSLNSF